MHDSYHSLFGALLGNAARRRTFLEAPTQVRMSINTPSGVDCPQIGFCGRLPGSHARIRLEERLLDRACPDAEVAFVEDKMPQAVANRPVRDSRKLLRDRACYSVRAGYRLRGLDESSATRNRPGVLPGNPGGYGKPFSAEGAGRSGSRDSRRRDLISRRIRRSIR